MAMIYNRTARQVLVDLINEGNPDLPFPINMTDYEFTRPETIEELPNGHNTEIRIIPKTTAPYIGNVVLTYRRLNLAYLFRNIVPWVRQWVPNNGDQDGADIISNLHSLLPLFSKKYGILLETSQIQNVSLRNRNGLRGDNFDIRAEPESLIFVGATQANWVLGRRTLEDLIQIDDIDGRLYPDGNDFSDMENRKVYLTPLFHNIDFTMYHQENGSDWDNANSTFWTSSLSTTRRRERIYEGIIDTILKDNTPYALCEAFDSWDNHYDEPRERDGVLTVGIAKMHYDRISLPDDRYPEANSEFFNHVIVITVPENCAWGTGNIYLHYNK